MRLVNNKCQNFQVCGCQGKRLLVWQTLGQKVPLFRLPGPLEISKLWEIVFLLKNELLCSLWVPVTMEPTCKDIEDMFVLFVLLFKRSNNNIFDLEQIRSRWTFLLKNDSSVLFLDPYDNETNEKSNVKWTKNVQYMTIKY